MPIPGKDDESVGKLRDALREAVRQNPTDVTAWRQLGATCLVLGKLEEAYQAFREAVRLAPRDVSNWSNLAATLLALKDFKAARDAAQEATRLDPESARAWRDLSTAQLGLGNFEAVRDAAEEAIRLRPTSGACFNLGVALLKLDILPEAEEALQQAVQLDPANNGAWGALAALYERLGNPSKAEECKRRANASEGA
jgi:cytochrome c-type biogenesis protein CcmH/NrfG